ncbi:hypothetical protein [Streptomyces sp. NPDC046942]|uniref:hypothetical protein n=1 Tax=Streptomyces sp. NPDC046942 TaxID=3155137 RepID=UPI0033EB08D8
MRHSLYGVRDSGVSEVVLEIGSFLNCDFKVRESDYLGVYQVAIIPEGKIQVIAQPDPEGEPIEDEFKEYATLIYIDGEFEIPQIDGLLLPRGRLERLRSYEVN